MTIDPLLNKIFNERYTLRRKLSEGGYGSVYEATDAQSSSLVAMKILRSRSNNAEIVGRFSREARIITKLQHPNIVQLFDHGRTTDGIQWLAFELVLGETLEQRSSRGPLDERELISLLLLLLSALQEAHQQGVIHRDLTPRNIILKESGAPCILDFGLASLRDDSPLTASTLISGTPRYMPPEQWRGLKFAEPSSDLYSLGVVAYEALTGSLPFTAKSPLSWMKAHREAVPRPMGELLNGRAVSPALEVAILKALAKTIPERFASASDFAACLPSIIPVQDESLAGTF